MTDEVYDRLKRKLEIDALSLDQELIELPVLILECSEYSSEKLAQRDRAKNELDLAMAETADMLRSNWTVDAKGSQKQRSEAQIASELALSKTVQAAQINLEEAKFELALWQSMVDSLRAKRDSLRIIAELTISGYLSPNSILKDRQTEIRQASIRRRPTQTNND